MKAQNYSKKIRQPKNVSKNIRKFVPKMSKKIRKPEIVQKNCKLNSFKKKKK